jgi:predicted dehydrogenase
LRKIAGNLSFLANRHESVCVSIQGKIQSLEKAQIREGIACLFGELPLRFSSLRNTRASIMNRRDFLQNSALATAALGAGTLLTEAHAFAAPADEDKGAPINCAVIGLGPQGKEILASLAKTGYMPVVSVCDTYKSEAWLKKATESAPKATTHDDYRKVLDDSNVKAVFVATPSHKHKQIVLDAIAAGKHVYCEAPLAHTVEDARAIAKAAAAGKTVFATGLQYRANKQHHHVRNFMGDLKTAVGGRAQWHKRGTWMRGAPTNEREEELNWRLKRATSPGLMGEIGIHQLDIASWFLNKLPVSVSAFGGNYAWGKDGMEVPDTVQCMVEYPGNLRFMYDATLVSSHDGAYEMFMGDRLSVLLRDQRAWMFKEGDSELLGWEVYAKKQPLTIGDETFGVGIMMVADATQLLAQGKPVAETGTDVTKTALYQSVDWFGKSINKNEKVQAGALEGLQATVVALKANEAVLTGKPITFQKEWFEIG